MKQRSLFTIFICRLLWKTALSFKVKKNLRKTKFIEVNSSQPHSLYSSRLTFLAFYIFSNVPTTEKMTTLLIGKYWSWSACPNLIESMFLGIIVI